MKIKHSRKFHGLQYSPSQSYFTGFFMKRPEIDFELQPSEAKLPPAEVAAMQPLLSPNLEETSHLLWAQLKKKY
jgi:hypothetical protein